MQFIPVHCDVCARSELVSAQEIVTDSAVCEECSGPVRSLPGESYTDQDVGLFNDLRAALIEAGINQQNAAALGAQLEVRHWDQPGRALRRLAQVVPALGILELIVVNQPGALRKAEGMLATLLDALANSRRSSGISGVIPALLPEQKTGAGTSTR